MEKIFPVEKAASIETKEKPRSLTLGVFQILVQKDRNAKKYI